MKALQASGNSSVIDDIGDEAKDAESKRAQSMHYTRQINVPLEVPPTPGTPPDDASVSTDVLSIACLSDMTDMKLCEDAPPTLKLLKDESTRSANVTRAKVLPRLGSVGSVGERRTSSPKIESITPRSDYEEGYYKGGGSVCSSVGGQTMGSALTSVTGVSRLKPIKLMRPAKFFDFNIVNLPLLRDINRRVDLNEMVSLEYIAGGSHSQVYSAMWNNQSVIVKV